jgi:hypothetical protein
MRRGHGFIAARRSLDFMKRYAADPGENISHSAEQMCRLARESGQEVHCSFNDFELVAKPETQPREVLDWYDEATNARRAAYEASPEGIAARERQKEFAEQSAKAEAEGVLPFAIADQPIWDSWYGLTKREYFAGLAMQGFVAANPPTTETNPDMVAKITARAAVSFADALLAELAKDQP